MEHRVVLMEVEKVHGVVMEVVLVVVVNLGMVACRMGLVVCRLELVEYRGIRDLNLCCPREICMLEGVCRVGDNRN